MIDLRQFFAIGREVFPDATDEQVHFILLNHTGWPCWFAGDPLTICRQQLEDYRDGKWVDPWDDDDEPPN